MSVIICAVTLLGMVWEAIDSALGLKVMASVFILLFAFLIFRSVNRTFAE